MRHRYARWRRFAGVEGRITHGKHSSEHERPDRVRQIGLWRGRAARRCRSRHPSRGRESDWFIVLMTPSKETRRAEGRDRPGRNPGEGNRVRTQSRVALPPNLARVNAAARMAVQTRFTALFRQEVRRIWFNCLRRRSQKNRRMGWDWFEALTACWPLPQARITHPWTQSAARRG